MAYPGLSWRGIILGQSLLSDIEDVYGVIANKNDYADSHDANEYGISITQKASRERRLAGSVEVCVTTGWKIAVLAISVDFNDDVLPSSLENWVQYLGAPDIVTWSYPGWSYRDAIWSKSGLGLEVLIRGNVFDLIHYPELIYAEWIIFFPPARSTNDLLGWPYSGLRRTPPEWPLDRATGVQNPFDFEAMLGNPPTIEEF